LFAQLFTQETNNLKIFRQEESLMIYLNYKVYGY